MISRFKNPCNKCIVKPVCKNECSIYKDFRRKYITPSSIVEMGSIILYLSITIPTLTTIIKKFDRPYDIILMIVMLISIILTGVILAVKVEDKLKDNACSIPKKRDMEYLIKAFKHDIQHL